MSVQKTLCAAAVLSLALPLAADASTLLKNISFNYGTNTNTAVLPSTLGTDLPDLPVSDITAVTNPDGDDPVNNRYVRVFDTSTASGYTQFSDFFDFSDLGAATIDTIRISLHYAHVDSAPVDNGLPNFPDDDTGENWLVRISGGVGPTGGDGNLTDDYFEMIPGVGSGLGSETGFMTFDLTAADDTGGVTAFATSVANQGVRLRLREESGGLDPDIMWLDMATVQVFGTAAPVPLPASGLLLVGAVGGLAAWKKRRKAA